MDSVCVVIIKVDKFMVIVYKSQIPPIAEQVAIGSYVEVLKDKSICCWYRNNPILETVSSFV